MKREFEYLEDKGIALITISGTYDFDLETDFFKGIISKLKEHNSKGSLWDFREAKIVESTMTLFNRQKLYDYLDLERSRKRAIVLKEGNDDWQFLETVLVNRGWNVRLFTDYNLAIGWLTE